MNLESIKAYAQKLLDESGCDCYTYGNCPSDDVLNDLKEAYPGGMPYPYIDVANAILSISKPRPITRSPWRVHWETEDCCDGIDCDSKESAICCALDTLAGWEADAMSDWASSTPTPEEQEEWDYMIYNCGVSVAQYNPTTDEYDTVWEPTEDDLAFAGWLTCDELFKRGILPLE